MNGVGNKRRKVAELTCQLDCGLTVSVTDLTEITKAIARHRRAMPRNEDAMLICNELERRLAKADDRPFDRTAYQRELMRKRRAAEKTK